MRPRQSAASGNLQQQWWIGSVWWRFHFSPLSAPLPFSCPRQTSLRLSRKTSHNRNSFVFSFVFKDIWIYKITPRDWVWEVSTTKVVSFLFSSFWDQRKVLQKTTWQSCVFFKCDFSNKQTDPWTSSLGDILCLYIIYLDWALEGWFMQRCVLKLLVTTAKNVSVNFMCWNSNIINPIIPLDIPLINFIPWL